MGNEFYFINNETAKNIQELKNSINKLKYEEFMHHVSFDHNHFANWIEDVYKDKETAKKLRSTVSKREILAILDLKLNPQKTVTQKTQVSKKTAKTSNKNTKSATKTTEHTTKNIAHNARKNLHLKSKIPNHPVSYVSTDSPEKFVLKEFLMGALFGLILGFVLMAMATNAGL